MHKQRFQRSILFILSCLLLMFCYPSATSANQTEKTSVLLVYDSLAKGTPKEGNVEAVQRLLASFGVQVTVTSYESYEKGMLLKFSKVITIRNADDVIQTLELFKQDMNEYVGEYMHIGNGLPANIRQDLNLEDQLLDQDNIRLAIGQFSQSSITASNITFITKFNGTSYGQITSERKKTTSPYGVLHGKYAYIPYMVNGNLSEQAAAFVLKDWLSVKTVSHSYVLLNEIYPFSDLEMLSEMAERLYEAGIPFIVSVQPVLNNLDFPAMQRYLEAIKHIQSRNGSIVVNAPVVNSTISQDITILKSQMSSFLDALAAYGIVPLGVGTELYWTYDQHYSGNGLSFFQSGIIFPNQRIMYRAQTSTSSAFTSAMYTIQSKEISNYVISSKTIDPLPMNTAFVYPFPINHQEMEETLDTLLTSWTTFDDYKNDEHSVRTEKNELTSHSGHLLINGQAIALNNAITEIDSDHTYVREVKKSFATLFSVQNNIFIVLILTTLLIFMVFLIIGYRMYKRKFTHQERSL
ncbi:hypothetical protein AB4114_00665 [Paenibacillus sp. 2RAB27]|uniref:hypothetical protein n=1 Tax=Paenibacillus sp. 2RAB27 TaxID=3232991 RepID=UPI003F9ABB6C